MATPDWDLFQSLHAVLAAGTLSAAAKARGLTQPTVGRHIDTLERQLGAPLFLRSPKGLQPTDLALALKPHLEDMAAAAGAALRDVSQSADGAGGVVRVAASIIVGVEVLPEILTAFREAHPAIDVELVVSNALEDLTRRDADIAVRMARPTQNTLVAKKVGELSMGFYATAEYLARHGTPRTYDELAEHALIGFDRALPPMPDNLDIGRPISRELFALRSDNDCAQLAALRAGFGVGVCQHQIGRRSGLLAVLPGMLDLKLDVWVCMHENLKGSRRMRAMFDFLSARLAAYCAEA